MNFIAIEYLVSKVNRSVAFLSLVDEYLFGLRLSLTNHNRSVWLYDAGFFNGYFSQSVAEHCHVIQGNISDYAKFWLYHIGRVQTSAQTHLDDCDIDFFLCKIVESHACRHLEERELHLLEFLFVVADEVDDILFRNHQSVDADALTEVEEVRGSVQASLVSTFLEYGCQCVRHCAFAIGASDVHCLKTILWIA